MDMYIRTKYEVYLSNSEARRGVHSNAKDDNDANDDDDTNDNT